jgi:nucleotide-binding universal stress UspA family protein
MKNILCATDGTPHGDKGVIFAADIAAKTGANLSICIVNELQGGLRGPPIFLHDSKIVNEILSNAVTIAESHGAKKVSKVELDGREIAATIVRYAKQQGVDHIVTGTGGKGGVARLVLGSVATSVVQTAECPVTVAR